MNKSAPNSPRRLSMPRDNRGPPSKLVWKLPHHHISAALAAYFAITSLRGHNFVIMDVKPSSSEVHSTFSSILCAPLYDHIPISFLPSALVDPRVRTWQG